MQERYLIFINLVGTLLNSEEKISDYTKKILNNCKNENSKIIINTSQNYITTLKMINEINIDYLSCFSGNYIVSKNKVYKENYLPSFISNKIIKLLKEKKIDFIVECLNKTYRSRRKKYEFIDSIFLINGAIIEKCFEFLIFSNKDLKVIENIIAEQNLTLRYDKDYKIYRILPKNSNKVNALKMIKEKDYKTISVGDDISDYETLNFSDIGIKMKNSTGLDDFDFWTYSNDEDGVAYFLSNFYNLELNLNHKKVKILDCTLRDGGHLNDCNFGYKNICSVIKNLVNANTDIIEIGFLENCKYDKNKTKFNKVSEAEKILKNIDSKNSLFALLMQVDKYDIKKLKKCNGKIKIIRLSFHKELLEEAIKYLKIIKENGYICSINPINFSGYSNFEMINLIKKINKTNVDYFSIVDTFGILLNNDFSNKLNLINNLLNKKINVGLHLHDNLTSAFSTAQILMQTNTQFGEVIIDSSLMGMGRDPGNLKTELIMYYLNKYDNGKYNLNYIYKLLENEISLFKIIYNWNQDFSYSISAFEKVHRSYAEYLKNKKVGYEVIEKLIKKIPINDKTRYNEKIIEKILKGEK